MGEVLDNRPGYDVKLPKQSTQPKTMKQLLTALIKAKADFLPIKKDKSNPYFNSKYADLDAILSATEPALLINGLSIVQTTKVVEGSMILVTTLYHESGESISSEYFLCNLNSAEEAELDKYGKPKKINIHQKIGSALTYARRYSYCALLSVTADDDDDGNNSQSAPNKPDSEREQLMNESSKLFAHLNMSGKVASDFISEHFGVPQRANLDNQKLRQLIEKLEHKRVAVAAKA